MEISAGLLIIKDNQILLCHPTNAAWENTYSIPKGKFDKLLDNDLIDTAIRETEEEIGVTFSRDDLTDLTERVILYKNRKGKTYKKVFYFPIFVDKDLKMKLEEKEVDWAEFLNKKDAEKRIFWRFYEMLSFID